MTPRSFSETLYRTTAAGQIVTEIAQRMAAEPAVATERHYDVSGRLVKVVQPNPDAPASAAGTVAWTYAYDARGLQTAQIDPRDTAQTPVRTLFAYDEHGNRTSRTLPEGQAEHWTYDSRGRMLTHVDFKGQTTAYAYDDSAAAGGRLAGEYRFAAGVTAVDGQGQIVTANAAERTDRAYDALGRLSAVSEYLGTTLSRTTSYSYDPVTGGLATVASPEGVVRHGYDAATGRLTRTWTGADASEPVTDTRYDYDEQGRLWHATAVVLNGQPVNLITTYSYDAAGNLDTVELPNGVLTDYDFNDLNRLVLETIKRGSTLIAKYDYDLESDGQRDQLTEWSYDANGQNGVALVTDWTYDAWGRLTREVRGAVTDAGYYDARYGYDVVGNRLTKQVDTDGQAGWEEWTDYVSLDRNDRLLFESGSKDGQTYSIAYTYDANGSLTNKVHSAGGVDTEVNFQYDPRNRMVAFDADGDGTYTSAGDVAYAYDHAGDRVSKVIVGGTATHYLVDAQNLTGYSQVLEEAATAGGAPQITYVLGHDVIGQVDSAGEAAYLGYDGHGSTRLLTDDAGDVSERYDYDAFGNHIFSGVASTNLLYSGEQWDDALQQQYLRARYYDAGIGRFSRMDDFAGFIGSPTTLHKFGYAEQNPITFIDPSGKYSVLEAAVGATILTVAAAFLSIPSMRKSLMIPHVADPWMKWKLSVDAAGEGGSQVIGITGFKVPTAPTPAPVGINTPVVAVPIPNEVAFPIAINSVIPDRVKGFVGEYNGYNQALDGDEVGVQPPGDPNHPGPDYVTLKVNPNGTGTVKVYDAKFNTGPRTGAPLPEAKLSAWMQEVEQAVNSMRDGPLKRIAQQAIRVGRVVGEYYNYKRG